MKKGISGKLKLKSRLAALLTAVLVLTALPVTAAQEVRANTTREDKAVVETSAVIDVASEDAVLNANGEADIPIAEENVNFDGIMEETISDIPEDTLVDSGDEAGGSIIFEEAGDDAADEDAVLLETGPDGDGDELPTGTMFNLYINNGSNTNIVSGSTVPMGDEIYGRIYTYRSGDGDHKAFYMWAAGEITRMSDEYWNADKNGYYNDNTSTIKNADTIVVEEGITYLGNHAFYGGGAANILLPGSISGLGSYAFSKMPSLSTVKLDNCTELETISDEAFSETPNLEAIVFPSGIKTIGEGAFRASGLKTINLLPTALETLKTGAFKSCPYLASTEENPIIIPKSLNSVYVGGAFTNCPKIEYLTFEEGMTKIPQNIVYGCKNIRKVKLPSTAVEIGIGAFQDSTSLNSIDFNNAKITKMDQQVFEGCTALENISLPATLTQMGSSVFKNCTSLKSIRIPDGVTKLDHIFEGCTSLESVELPDTLVEIGNSCFRDCTSLKHINWPGSLAFIGEYAFRQTALEGEIELPKNVVQIGDYAFSTCLSANRVKFPGCISSIGLDPFYSMSADYIYAGNRQEWAKVTIYKMSGLKYQDNADSYITQNLTYTIEDYVEPTDIALKKTSFKVGDKFKLEADVSPEGASPNVTWNGYSSSIVKPVYTWGSQFTTGEFTALKAGTFTVTCASKDAKVSRQFEITITEADPPAPGPDPEPSGDDLEATGLELNKRSLSMYPQDTFKLSATVNPAGAKEKTVLWITGDPDTVKIDDAGKITALKAGEVTITATVKGTTVSATCTVTVLPSEIVEKGEDDQPINPGNKAVDTETGETRIWVAGLDKEYCYTGKPIKPAIHVYRGYKLLTAGSDYTVKYKNNKNISTAAAEKNKPRVIITMKGAYSGSKTETFEIKAMPVDKLSSADAELKATYKEGKKNQLKPTLIYNEAGVKYGKQDVTFKWYETDGSGNATATESSCIDPGVYAVKVFPGKTGKLTGEAGKQIATVTVYDKPLLSSVKVNGFKAKLAYNKGNAVKQPENLKLTYKDKSGTRTLSENTSENPYGDYTVTYKNNYKPGTATVIYKATDVGAFRGRLVKTYKVTGKSVLTEAKGTAPGLNEFKITLDKTSYEFTNSAVKPGVTVTARIINNYGNQEEITLRQGSDYTVKYKNNKAVAADNATKKGKDIAPQVIIKSKGNYSFSGTQRFSITPADLSGLVLTVSDRAYSRKAGDYKKTKILFTDMNYRDLKLKAGKDYTVDYAVNDTENPNAPAAGKTVTVTITAKKDAGGNWTGSYKGTAKGSYRITDSKKHKDIGKTKVIINPNSKGKTQPCIYTGSGIEPGQTGQPVLKITFGSGKNIKELEKGKDYEILGYYNNVNKGKGAVVLVRGIGNDFRGVRAVKFKISAAGVGTRWGGFYGID